MPAPPSVVKDVTISPLLGTFLTVLLYGATCTQVYMYYNTYTADRTGLKVLVGAIFILETMHAAFGSHYIFYYLINHYGELEYLGKIVWSLDASVTIGFLITWTVNQFFIHRIYILSKGNLLLSVALGALATVRPGFGIAIVSMAAIYPEWTIFEMHARWIMITGLSIGLTVDSLITLCITYLLTNGREVGNTSTRNLIHTLMMYSVNTGAVLVFFGTIELVGILVWSKNLAYLGLFQVQIQLYANCFLTSLNARQAISSGLNMTTMQSTNLHFSPYQSHPTGITTGVTSTMEGDGTKSVFDPRPEKSVPV